MPPERLPSSPSRGRLVQISFVCDPISSMESRLGWYRAVGAAEHFDTWVICDEQNRPHIDAWFERQGPVPGLHIEYVSSVETETIGCFAPGISYRRYHRWHQRAFEVASELHQEWEFGLAHQIGLCGFREPGYLWKLGIPFVWGPIGGTQNLPWRYWSLLGPCAGTFEAVRGVINRCHLKHRRRVKSAVQHASKIFAANTTAQRDFADAHGADLELQLETGLKELPSVSLTRKSPDRPLRILWSGRFRPWKGLPILLRALAGLVGTLPFELRLTGNEDFRPYQAMASKLGLDDHLQWLGRLEHEDTMPHYQWADVFAFTSLRDTSGTGLLEALAYGCPIIGMDHQGAHDIMDETCGVPIPITTPEQSIKDFQSALLDLFHDPDKLLSLGQGAIDRAADFHWQRLNDRMIAVYQSLMPTQQRCGSGKCGSHDMPFGSASPPNEFVSH